MVKPLKISIDYHGVIDQNPSFFRIFTKKAINQEIQIYILSGGSKEDVAKYLHNNDISYTHIFSLLDNFKEQNLVTLSEDGNFFVSPDLWNQAKATFCLKEKIDFHIDDSAIYGQYFQTPFCLYDSSSEKCHDFQNNINIRFSDSPETVLKNILLFLNSKRQKNLTD